MTERFPSETDDYNEWMAGIAERQAVLSREVRVLTKHMGPEDKQWGHNPAEVVVRLEDMRREIESLRSRVIVLENEKDAQGQRKRWMKEVVDETKPVFSFGKIAEEVEASQKKNKKKQRASR